MSLRSLPEAPTMARPRNYQWDAPSDVLAKWAETAPVAAAEDDRSIASSTIGDDHGPEAASRQCISAALRAIGDRTTVRSTPRRRHVQDCDLQSLRAHPAKVTVEVRLGVGR